MKYRPVAKSFSNISNRKGKNLSRYMYLFIWSMKEKRDEIFAGQRSIFLIFISKDCIESSYFRLFCIDK